MEEVVAEEDMTPKLLELSKLDFLLSCFYTGFNGPTDPGYAHIAHTNSSDPLTLLQATKRPDWHKWEAAIQDELKSLEAFSTFEVVTLPPAYHYVRECNKEKRLRYEFLSGALQPADMFTKPLPHVTLARHIKQLGFGGV